MKYYSEITKNLYDSKEELVKAEAEVVKSKADRAERAKEVNEALKAATAAQKKANELLAKFVKDYGSFKTTLKDEDVDVRSFWDIFDKFMF